MGKLVNISEAAQVLGVTTTTLRNWDKNLITLVKHKI